MTEKAPEVASKSTFSPSHSQGFWTKNPTFFVEVMSFAVTVH